MKRVLSGILVFVLLFTLVPMSVFAATAVPGGYTKVDYIESDGTGYIDTEWSTAGVTSGWAYEIDFAPAAVKPSANGSMFGSWNSNTSINDGRAGLLSVRAKGTTRFGFGKTSAGSTASYVPCWNTTTDRQMARVEIDHTTNTYSVTKDGSAGGVTNATGSINGTTVSSITNYVFAGNNGAKAAELGAGKVYGLRIWENGTLVRDFVPCVESTGGTAGLYDLVNGKFHAAEGGIYGPAGAPQTTVTFTTPSDVTLTVQKGFADGGEEQTKTSAVTVGGITTHTYTLPTGPYRFIACGENSVAGSKIEKYYNWDKNFVVSYADVQNGGKTIDADPGLLAGTGWEQARTARDYYVRQFTDEVLNAEDNKVSDALKEKYAPVFTTPSFGADKARHEFTTQTEMEQFVASCDGENDDMYTYTLGKSGDGQNILAVLFTGTDIAGKTLYEAAEAVDANGKPTVQIQAQVHGDEQSGTEGALALIKMLSGEWGASVLGKVNVMILPRVNTDGTRDYKYRTSDKALNINRDYLLLSENETQLLVELYNVLRPEVVMDMHEHRPNTETLSGTIPDVLLALTDNLNVPAELSALSYEYMDNQFAKLKEDGLRPAWYRDGATDTSPVNAKEYYTLRGSIGFISETTGQRKGKQMWDRRVLTQCLSAKTVIDYTAANADTVVSAVAKVREDITKQGKNYDESSVIVLEHDNGTPITYKQPRFNMLDGTWSEGTTNIYRKDKATLTRPRPLYYVIPKDAAGASAAVATAEKHLITYEEISADEVMELRQYSGDGAAATLGTAQLYSFENGAYKFPVAQESGAVLVILMEPDVLDARKNASELHKASFVQQGVLDASDIYRCEADFVHALTYVPATAAKCDADGCTAHYICTCGKGFATEEHINPLEQDSWVIPMTGHDYEQQSDYSYVCANSCGEAAANFTEAVANCEGCGGKVTLSLRNSEQVNTLVVPANVSVDLNVSGLYVENGLTVNAGGKITNGDLSVSDDAAVSLGDNGGWVPVYSDTRGTVDTYTLYPIEAKTGANVTYLDNGTKYAFGYQFANPYGAAYDPYGESVAANADSDLKFGVELSIYDGATADYSFTSESVSKMAGIDASDADEFFKVNLTLTGELETLNSVVVRPIVKVKSLGFRYEGAASEDNGPEVDVATFNGVNYTNLEDAVAAAEAAGGLQDITLIGNVNYKRPATLKVNGQIRFVVSGTDITVSGPVTFDGQKKEAATQLFRCTNSGKLTLKNGVTFVDYRNTKTDDNDVRTYGAAVRVDASSELVMENVTVRDCSAGIRGVVYVTGTSDFTAKNCTFTGNTASTDYGGAIAVFTGDTITVEGCTFTDNKAQTYGGAIYVQNDITLNVKNSTFADNEALNNNLGAAIYAGKRVTCTLDGVTVTGSIGKGAAALGSIYIWGDSSNKSSYVIKGDNNIESISMQSASLPITVEGMVTGSIGVYMSASVFASCVTNATQVLSGENIADCYTVFTPTNSAYTFTSAGKLVEK